MAFCTSGSSKRRPISRFTAYRVFLALVTAWRLAGAPTRISPSSVYATTEGVVRAPSEFSITLGLPPSMIATHELVVPRSMPMIFAMMGVPFLIQVCVGYGVCARFFNRFGDRHERRAEDPVVQLIPLLHHRHNGVR